MAQALFNSWFVDFDPVLDNALAAGNPIPEPLQAKADVRKKVRSEVGILPESQKEIQAMFPSSFVFNEDLGKWIPEGWEVKSVSEIGKVVTGKTPSSKTPEYFGEQYLFVTPTDFKNYFKQVINSSRKLSEIGKLHNENRILPINSILVTCIGSDMGKVVVNKEQCMTNQQINSIIPEKDVINSEYLYQYFNFIYDELRNLAFGGSTMPILNKTDFENISILLPSFNILTKFLTYAKAYDDKIYYNLVQIQSLIQQREVLLPQLVSGKVRVPQSLVEQMEKELEKEKV